MRLEQVKVGNMEKPGNFSEGFYHDNDLYQKIFELLPNIEVRRAKTMKMQIKRSIKNAKWLSIPSGLVFERQFDRKLADIITKGIIDSRYHRVHLLGLEKRYPAMPEKYFSHWIIIYFNAWVEA